ncbi:MAG: hypothetical protein H6891_09195 [Brucellaceae bacterium]|nr:hypothetical protein [Brucellaceae bacterium]
MDETAGIDDRMSRIGFGTSGVRGLVSDLVPQVVGAYSRAFAGWLTANGLADRARRCWSGTTCAPRRRRSRLVIAALRECGFAVSYAGALPTPALAFHALRNGWPAVVITGSHIPFDRNGIKFYRPDGEILKEDEADIVARLAGVSRAACSPADPLPEPDGARAPPICAATSISSRPACWRPPHRRSTNTGSVARDLLQSFLRARRRDRVDRAQRQLRRRRY